MTDPKILAEALEPNCLKEAKLLIEESNTAGLAQFGQLAVPLLEKIYGRTLVSQIASVQPLKSPIGKVAAVLSEYSGYNSNLDNLITMVASSSNLTYNQFVENTRVIVLDGSYTLQNGDLLNLANGTPEASGTNVVRVLYSEIIYYKYLISDTTSAAPASGTLLDSGLQLADGPYNEGFAYGTVCLVINWNASTLVGYSVSGVSFSEAASGISFTEVASGIAVSGYPQLLTVLANRTAIKKYFTRYTGNFSGIITDSNYTNYGGTDSNANVRYIDFVTRAVTLETKTRKIASKLSWETLQDIKSIYGKNYTEVLAKIVGQELGSEIDIEVLSFLRTIARPMNDIYLTYSLGMDASTLIDISSDLVVNINMAVEEIVQATRRNRTMFVVADAATCGYLKINPWHVKPETNTDNPHKVGMIGAYPLYCDMFAQENYILIGYNFDSEAKGDAGLIFAPYSHVAYEFKDDTSQFQPRLLTMNRYAYCRHPQDTGTGIGDSDFFRVFQVFYTGETPLTPRAGVYDLPNFSKNILKYI